MLIRILSHLLTKRVDGMGGVGRVGYDGWQSVVCRFEISAHKSEK